MCTCMCRCVTVKASVLRTYSHDVLLPAAGAKVTRSGGGSNSRNISSLLPHQPLHVQLLLRDRGRCLCWPVPPAVPVSVAVGGGGAVGRHGRGRRALHGSQSKGRQGLVALERKCLVPTGGARRLASWGGLKMPARLWSPSLLASPLCASRPTKGLDIPRLFLVPLHLREPGESAKRPETGNASN